MRFSKYNYADQFNIDAALLCQIKMEFISTVISVFVLIKLGSYFCRTLYYLLLIIE